MSDGVDMLKSAALQMIIIAVYLELLTLDFAEIFFGIFESNDIKKDFCIIILQTSVVMHLIAWSKIVRQIDAIQIVDRQGSSLDLPCLLIAGKTRNCDDQDHVSVSVHVLNVREIRQFFPFVSQEYFRWESRFGIVLLTLKAKSLQASDLFEPLSSFRRHLATYLSKFRIITALPLHDALVIVPFTSRNFLRFYKNCILKPFALCKNSYYNTR